MIRLLPLLLFLWASLALAQEVAIPSWAATMMYWETLNSYKPETEVNEKFQPGSRQIFGIKSMDIPTDELHVVDSGAGGDLIRSQIEFEKNGKKYFRFFVHPESEHLYQELLDKYGAKELYWAAATASTRSLLAWPKDPKDGDPLFLKLSLAKQQDGLGRIIPDWEVRRSVGITELVQSTPQETWMNSGASIIPEIMGAYVDKKEKLGFYVDANQGKVEQHGLIIRDAAFLKEAQVKGWEVRPLFSLFTPQEGDKAPLIIEKWKESGKPFVKFVEDYLFKPFIEKNAYLFFQEHIVPEIHGQNVLVAVDPVTKEIKHFYHRDVGSMKVDLRMRWLQGKTVEPLRTPNAAYDFKFERATSAVEDVYENYLNDWLFRWTYKDEIQKYVKGFEPEQTLSSLKTLLRKDAAKRFPLKKKDKAELTVTERLEAYIQENAPTLVPLEGKPAPAAKMAAFLNAQKKNDQRIELPDSWIKAWKLKSGAKVITSQGVVVVGRKGSKAYLYFHRKRVPEVLKVPVAKAVKAKGLRVGFYSGTFDPPHAGHKHTLDTALKELDLDVIYVLPTPTPEHKPNALSFEIRKEMSVAYFSGDPRVRIADADLAEVAEKQGVGGLQRYLAQRHAKDQVFQVMGDDAFTRLVDDPTITFPKNFTVVVNDRGADLELPKRTAGGNAVIGLEAKGPPGLSSTKMREKIAAGIKPDEISDKVYAIIQREQAYGAKPDICAVKYGKLKQPLPPGPNKIQ